MNEILTKQLIWRGAIYDEQIKTKVVGSLHSIILLCSLFDKLIPFSY